MSSAPAIIPRPTAKPRRRRNPAQPVVRLQTPGGRSPSPFIPTPTVVPQLQSRKRLTCPISSCRSTDIVEESGLMVCGTCGTIVDNGNPFVSDQQWTETAAGASQPQGTYVAQDQSHSRTAMTLPGGRLMGDSGASDGLKTRNEAKSMITRIANVFHIPESVQGPANAIFALALKHGFLSGRTLQSVCAVCFYIACRRVRDPESQASSIMLIDIAEHLDMNVFLLGSTYTKLVDALMLRKKDNPNERVEAMPPETLVARFARDLDFGRDTNTIKRDAINIVKRMNRDWMVTGRRQAGVVGAAIILAARMNNYRRTVREVVLVAKVTEITINKRLEEFQFTESSNLTVEAFKDNDIRNGLRDTDPPSYYRAMGLGPAKKKKRKRGRPRKNPLPETAAEIEDDDEDEDTAAQEAAKRVRLDAQGFKIPPLPPRSPPIDPRLQPEIAAGADPESQPQDSNTNPAPSDTELTEQDSLPTLANATAASSRPRRLGRPPGRKNWQPPPPSPAEIVLETELEHDMRYVLDHNDAPPRDSIADTPKTSDTALPAPSLYPPVPDAYDRVDDPSVSVVSAWQSTPEASRPAVNSNFGNTGTISLSPTLGATEFDDDPEVSVCMLTPIESAIKERIWVDENAEWLRKDSLKRVKKELKEKERREKGGGEEIEKKGRRKKAGKIGDVSYLDRPESGEEESRGDGVVGANGETRRERSMEESVRRMMAVRAPALSRRINYGVLNELFGNENGSSGSRSGSRSGSMSVASPAGTEFSAGGAGERSKMSLAATKREAAKKEARMRAKAAAEKADGEESGSSSSASPTPPAEGSSTQAAIVPPPIPTISSTPAVSTSSTASQQNRRQRRQALSKSPYPTPPENPATTSQNEDEVLGSVDETELSSLTSSKNSPMLAVSSHGFGEEGEDDEDESSGDDDDYVDDDIDAAFEGRSSRRRRDAGPVDDEDEDDA